MHEERTRQATVHGLPIQQNEYYVTRVELAALMHVSVASIDRMVKAGMPHERWGMRAVRFLPSRALAWARQRGTAL